jgi:hypothetical protein
MSSGMFLSVIVAGIVTSKPKFKWFHYGVYMVVRQSALKVHWGARFPSAQMTELGPIPVCRIHRVACT